MTGLIYSQKIRSALMSPVCLAEYECKARGAGRMAYPSVVAGGQDSCTIHYLRNNKVSSPLASSQ